MRHILDPQSPLGSRRHPARRAFGLIELLVVIVIIGFLLGFLWALMARGQQNAVRITCVNNLKQIVLAAHNYHSANKNFPPGYCTDTGAGVLMYLLPYVEHDAVYNRLPEDLRDGTGGSWLKNVGGLKCEQHGQCEDRRVSLPRGEKRSLGGGHRSSRELHQNSRCGCVGGEVYFQLHAQ